MDVEAGRMVTVGVSAAGEEGVPVLPPQPARRGMRVTAARADATCAVRGKRGSTRRVVIGIEYVGIG